MPSLLFARRPASPFGAGAALLACLLSPAATAQTNPGWSPDYGLPGVRGGTSERVEEVCAWNGDLYVAGRFRFAGNAVANSVARWDGQQFHPLDGGLDYGWNSGYREMVVHGGTLIVAGDFTTGSGQNLSRIARWDGTAWSPLGAGLDGTVDAVAVHDGSLLAGGIFTKSGETTVGHLARWTGTAWEPFADVDGYAVLAIGHYGPDLVIGGSFSAVDGVPCANVARFDGVAWHALGNGTDGWVWDFTELDGDLYAGGDFTLAGGTAAGRIARWNGTLWSAVGVGFDTGRVQEVLAFAGDVYAAGTFQGAGGVQTFAYWDGAAWRRPQPILTGSTRSLALWNGNLAVGGTFPRAGPALANHVAAWTGGTWLTFGSGLGIPGTVRAIEPYAGDIVFGGSFTSAGAEPVTNICAWNRVEYLPLGAGLDGAVNSLLPWNGALVAGGAFIASGVTSLPRVAAWDGAAWQPMGPGLPGVVNALAVVGGDLLAGGSFQLGPNGSRVARWTGSDWEPVTFGPGGPVHALAEFQGELHVGGDFAFAGQVPASHVAAWTGTHWRPMDRGREHPVSSLLVRDDQLVVVGTDDMYWLWWLERVRSVGLWSGSGWDPLPAPYPGWTAFSAGTYRGELLVGGAQLLRLHDLEWTELDGLVSGEVLVIREIGSDLWIGGAVESAGGWASQGVAHYVGGPPRTALLQTDHPARPGGRALSVPSPYVRGMQIEAGGAQAAGGLEIFDVRGRRVQTLRPRTVHPDGVTYDWDGRTRNGTTAPAGMYFVRFLRGGERAAKLLLLR